MMTIHYAVQFDMHLMLCQSICVYTVEPVELEDVCEGEAIYCLTCEDAASDADCQKKSSYKMCEQDVSSLPVAFISIVVTLKHYHIRGSPSRHNTSMLIEDGIYVKGRKGRGGWNFD